MLHRSVGKGALKGGLQGGLKALRPVNRRKRQRLCNALSSLIGGALPSLRVLQLAGMEWLKSVASSVANVSFS